MKNILLVVLTSMSFLSNTLSATIVGSISFAGSDFATDNPTTPVNYDGQSRSITVGDYEFTLTVDLLGGPAGSIVSTRINGFSVMDADYSRNAMQYNSGDADALSFSLSVMELTTPSNYFEKLSYVSFDRNTDVSFGGPTQSFASTGGITRGIQNSITFLSDSQRNVNYGVFFTNTAALDGASSTQYIISNITINYELLPEPSSIMLLFLALLVFHIRRYKE